MLSTSTHPAFVGFIVSALVIFLSGFHLLRTATSELSWGQLCTWVSHVHLYPTLRVICRARQRTLLTLPIFNVHKPSTKKIFGCTSLLLIGDFIGLKFPHLSEKAQGTTWRKRDTLPERHVVSGVWKWLEDLSASRHTDTDIIDRGNSILASRVSWHPNFRVPVRGRLLPFRSGPDHPYELPCIESLFFTPLFWCPLPQELYPFWRASNVIIRTTLRTHICSCSRYRCFHQCCIELGVLTWCRCHNLSRVQTVF